MAAALDLDFALFHKERKKANEIARMVLVGNVQNKTAILIDDMADTCGTMALAAKHLLAGGAKEVLALVTHGILSGPALKVLEESSISKMVVTNTIPQRNHMMNGSGGGKIREIDVSHVLAEAVRRSHWGESISVLFHSVPHTAVSSAGYSFLSRVCVLIHSCRHSCLQPTRMDYAESTEESEAKKVSIELNTGVVKV